MGETYLEHIVGTENQNRKADIIFVHGLGGDARGTWHPQARKDDNNFWSMWLGEDFQECGIWSVNYQVEPATWKGHTMPLLERATNVVDLLDGEGLGQNPIIFITHSMGGLVVKQLLCNATYSKQASWQRIVEQTIGIVYLSTPHSGSHIANWFKYIGRFVGASISVKELQKNSPILVDLNAQYCHHERLNKIPVLVYYEKQEMEISRGLFGGSIRAIVVDKESANPGRGLKALKFIPVDEDHISISKPNSKGHPLYKGVQQFIEECLSNSRENVSSEDKDFQANDQQTNSESNRGMRNIYINQGNYNENIQGNYIQPKKTPISSGEKLHIQQELDDLEAEREVIYNQYRGLIEEGQKLRLSRQLNDLDVKIDNLKDQINDA